MANNKELLAFPTQAAEPEEDVDIDQEEELEDDNGTDELKVKVRGKTCTVVYDKYGLTPKLMKRILDVEHLTGNGSTADTIRVVDMSISIITKLVVEWDVVDVRGQAVAITAEALEEGIDINSLLTLVMALQGAVMPGEPTGSASSTASPAGGSVTSYGRAKSASRSGTSRSKRRNA